MGNIYINAFITILFYVCVMYFVNKFVSFRSYLIIKVKYNTTQINKTMRGEQERWVQVQSSKIYTSNRLIL